MVCVRFMGVNLPCWPKRRLNGTLITVFNGAFKGKKIAGTTDC